MLAGHCICMSITVPEMGWTKQQGQERGYNKCKYIMVQKPRRKLIWRWSWSWDSRDPWSV